MRVASHPVTCDTQASYMAWIAPIPPSARTPTSATKFATGTAKTQRPTGIFPTKRLAPPSTFGEYVATKGGRRPA